MINTVCRDSSSTRKRRTNSTTYRNNWETSMAFQTSQKTPNMRQKKERLSTKSCWDATATWKSRLERSMLLCTRRVTRWRLGSTRSLVLTISRTFMLLAKRCRRSAFSSTNTCATASTSPSHTLSQDHPISNESTLLLLMCRRRTILKRASVWIFSLWRRAITILRTLERKHASNWKKTRGSSALTSWSSSSTANCWPIWIWASS